MLDPLSQPGRVSRHQSGQAVVETALTLPLVLFLMLGTMQLFMISHARILAQLAAYRATRVASTNQGDCKRMLDAALVTLMPAVEPFLGRSAGSPGEKLAAAYAKRRTNRYSEVISGGGLGASYTGAIVWIDRSFVGAGFDQPGELMRLESRLVFWCPLRIPFANWVLSRMYLAHAGIKPYTGQNPLSSPKTAAWGASGSASANLDAAVRSELLTRVSRGEYVFPVHTTFTMRMMTPLKPSATASACQ